MDGRVDIGRGHTSYRVLSCPFNREKILGGWVCGVGVKNQTPTFPALKFAGRPLPRFISQLWFFLVLLPFFFAISLVRNLVVLQNRQLFVPTSSFRPNKYTKSLPLLRCDRLIPFMCLFTKVKAIRKRCPDHHPAGADSIPVEMNIILHITRLGSPGEQSREKHGEYLGIRATGRHAAWFW